MKQTPTATRLPYRNLFSGETWASTAMARLEKLARSFADLPALAKDPAKAIALALSHYTYKPGFEFGLRVQPDWFAIDLHVSVADVRDAGKNVELTMPGHRIPWCDVAGCDDERVGELVRNLVDRITEAWEQHERAEWLRYQGDPIHQDRLDRDHGWPAP